MRKLAPVLVRGCLGDRTEAIGGFREHQLVVVAEALRVEQVLLELLGSLGPGEAAILGAIIGSLTA
jgi:hypothetical protein